jgi:hypothetical protein
MSIVGTALRISATRALAGAATLAGDRVFDSAILPIDELTSTMPKPFVVVSTEDEASKPAGRDIFAGDREIDLVLECSMTQVQPLPAKNGEEEQVMVLVPNTDAGLELALGVLNRQIIACLFGRGGGAWGEAFRGLTAGLNEVVSRRGASSKEGARYAARQTILTVRAIAEPPFGMPLVSNTPLAAFIAAAEADEATASIARVLREAIEGVPQDWPAVFSAAGMLAGYTDAEAQALGIYPLAPPVEGAPELAVEATVEGADGELWTVDADAIEAQLPEVPHA